MTQARIKITYRPSDESNKTNSGMTTHFDRDDDTAYKIYKMLVDLLTTLDEMRLERDDTKN